MEGSKRAEAGPSSNTAVGDENQASDPKPVEICTDDDDGDDPQDCGSFGKFVPSPLVPLKDQIEKDKVFVRFSHLSFSILACKYYFFNLFISSPKILHWVCVCVCVCVKQRDIGLPFIFCFSFILSFVPFMIYDL